MVPSALLLTVTGAPYSSVPSQLSVAEIVPRSTVAVLTGPAPAGVASPDGLPAQSQAPAPAAIRVAPSADRTSRRRRRPGSPACGSAPVTLFSTAVTGHLSRRRGRPPSPR